MATDKWVLPVPDWPINSRLDFFSRNLSYPSSRIEEIVRIDKEDVIKRIFLLNVVTILGLSLWYNLVMGGKRERPNRADPEYNATKNRRFGEALAIAELVPLSCLIAINVKQTGFVHEKALEALRILGNKTPREATFDLAIWAGSWAFVSATDLVFSHLHSRLAERGRRR